MNEKILLVEDNAEALDILRKVLEKENYRVTAAVNLREAAQCVASNVPDLIVLDVMLPDGSGLDYCRELRKTLAVPIIFLTVLERSNQIVAGLRMGADDYITKPYCPEELCARIAAHLRRWEFMRQNLAEEINIGPLKLDPVAQRVYFDGEDMAITPKEYQILLTLARCQKQYLSAAELYQKIWGCKIMEDTRTLFVHISTLRRRLKKYGVHQVQIERDLDLGYRICILD